MFDQINKYKASFGRLFEAKTLKVMLEIALLTILLSFLGPIKNMIYTEVVNKLSLGITVKLGIIMFASYIVVQVIEECVSYFQIYLNTVLQLKLGQSVSHEINNKLAKVKLNSLEMYEIHDLVSRANQTIKSSIVSSLNLIIALYTPLATIVFIPATKSRKKPSCGNSRNGAWRQPQAMDGLFGGKCLSRCSSAPEAWMTEPASRRFWTMCATAASTC